MVCVSCDEVDSVRTWLRDPLVDVGAVDTTLGAASVQIIVFTPPCSLKMTEGAFPGTFEEGNALVPFCARLASAWLLAAAVTAAATMAAGLTAEEVCGGIGSGSGILEVDEDTLLSNAGSFVLEVGCSRLMDNTAAIWLGWAWPLVAGRKGS